MSVRRIRLWFNTMFAVFLILENKIDLKFSENELTKLFRFATSQTNYFVGKILDQVAGVAMGSPLGPSLTNLLNHGNLIMADLLNFTVCMWTILFVCLKTSIRH